MKSFRVYALLIGSAATLLLAPWLFGVWLSGWPRSDAIQFDVAIGTIFLASVTLNLALSTRALVRETAQQIAAEDRRHRQQFSPVLVFTRGDEDPGAFGQISVTPNKRGSLALVGVFRNLGAGVALNGRVDLSVAGVKPAAIYRNGMTQKVACFGPIGRGGKLNVAWDFDFLPEDLLSKDGWKLDISYEDTFGGGLGRFHSIYSKDDPDLVYVRPEAQHSARPPAANDQRSGTKVELIP